MKKLFSFIGWCLVGALAFLLFREGMVMVFGLKPIKGPESVVGTILILLSFQCFNWYCNHMSKEKAE